jgi:hypothetical protein
LIAFGFLGANFSFAGGLIPFGFLVPLMEGNFLSRLALNLVMG